MQQSSSNSARPGSLLLAFVAGAIGGAAGALLVMPRGAPAGDSDAELTRSIAALDDGVRALSRQVAELGVARPQASSPSAQPTPLADTTDLDVHDAGIAARVIERLDTISTLLQSRAVASSGFPGSAPLPVLDATRATANSTALAALAAEDNEHHEIWRRHAFWTCQQVLDAYGLPDQIEAGDGSMGWYYEVPGHSSMHFVFFEGMLINVWN